MKRLLTTLACIILAGMTFANHWTPIGGTQYNMTMNGIILIDGVEQTGTTLEVGAFCGDECRGSMIPEFFPITNQYVVTLTVVSNQQSGEAIVFRLYDHSTNQELNLTSTNNTTFESNAMIGALGSWYEFAFVTPAFHFTTAGNWSTASNWQGGALPGANDAVFIEANCTLDQNATVAALTVSQGVLTLQSNKTLTVTGDMVNTSVAGLVIENGAQLVNASADVKATVKKNVKGYSAKASNGWYTIASPVSNMAIASSDFLTPEYDLYRYKETNNNNNEWENYKANHDDFTTFENGRGYLYAHNSTFSPAFTGTLNNAAVSQEVTYTERTDGLSGFNLIGNPFPHAIYKGTGGAIDNSKLASGYYTLTNEGAWNVHTYEDAIQPGQGILVKTIATMNVDIAKTTTAATAESTGAKSQVGRLAISLTGNNAEDRAFVYFAEGIGLEKMDNLSETAPSLSVRREGHDYAIAHVDAQCETIDVMFANRLPGNYTLAVGGESVSFEYLHLVDHVTGADIDLLHQPEYTFHATGNEYAARFMIVLRQNTGVGENQQQSFCFVKDGTLYMTAETEGIMSLTDVMGRTVRTLELKGNACSVSDLQAGIYVVRLVNGGNVQTQKIVVK